MLLFLGQRLVQLVPVLVGISLVTYALMNLAPGDPAEIILRQYVEKPTPEEIAAVRQELGLDRPFLERYAMWLGRAVRGDLGRSFRTGQPVSQELLDRLPATLELAVTAAVLALLLSLPLGVISALNHNRLLDHASRLFSLLGTSMPGFWLGLVLIWIFAVGLGLLPSFGRGSWQHIILPAAALALAQAGGYLRLLRASMLETLAQEFILASYAKGLRFRMILLGHVLRNAILPVVTAFGVGFGGLLSGAVIIENVFAWPGIGKFAVDGIAARDYPAVQGFVLFSAVVFVGVNLLVDLCYRYLDPRIEQGGGW